MKVGDHVIALRDTDGNTDFEWIEGKVFRIHSFEKSNTCGAGVMIQALPGQRKVYGRRDDARWIAVGDVIPADPGIAALYGFDLKEDDDGAP